MRKEMNHFDSEELLREMLNLSDNAEYDDIEDAVLEKLGVDFEQFHSVASALIKYTPTIKSPMTDNKYHAFVKNDDKGFMFAIAKVKVEE